MRAAKPLRLGSMFDAKSSRAGATAGATACWKLHIHQNINNTGPKRHRLLRLPVDPCGFSDPRVSMPASLSAFWACRCPRCIFVDFLLWLEELGLVVLFDEPGGSKISLFNSSRYGLACTSNVEACTRLTSTLCQGMPRLRRLSATPPLLSANF